MDSPATVLVVDDDLTVRDVVRRYLELAGHRVALADNGEDALAWIAGNDMPNIERVIGSRRAADMVISVF